jgi:hypothetical protein
MLHARPPPTALSHYLQSRFLDEPLRANTTRRQAPALDQREHPPARDAESHRDVSRGQHSYIYLDFRSFRSMVSCSAASRSANATRKYASVRTTCAATCRLAQPNRRSKMGRAHGRHAAAAPPSVTLRGTSAGYDTT